MSMMKRHLEDVAYRYLENHPEMKIEEVIDKITKGEIADEDSE